MTECNHAGANGATPKGYDSPNYTQIPNVFLDKQMPKIKSLAELKVVLAVMRQTFGWQKKADRLSLTQLIKLTGLSRPSTNEGVKQALAHGILDREEVGDSFRYWLVVKKLNHLEDLGSKDTLPEVVKKLNPQKKVKERRDRTTNVVLGEPNTSTAEKEQNTTQQQELTTEFYEAVEERYGIELEPAQFGYHIGKFKRILEKHSPTEEELERVINHMVERFAAAPKIDAVQALQDVRLGRDTGEAWTKPPPWEKEETPVEQRTANTTYAHYRDWTGGEPREARTRDEKWRELGARAEHLMNEGRNEEALELLDEMEALRNG